MTDSSALRLLAPSILSGAMRHLEEIPDFARVIASGFVSRKLEFVEVEEGLEQLIFTLIYVQDYSEPNDNLDELVIDSLRSYLESRGVLQHFLEINVNLSFL